MTSTHTTTEIAPHSMSPNRHQINWKNSIFLVGSHLLAIAAIVYLAVVECSPWTIGLGVAWFVFSGLSITAGYHRLFSHRAYQAHPILRGLFLLFGAAAVQNSALRWSADHRRHHAHTDREADPYSVTRGFFWSHVGWIMVKRTFRTDPATVRDLYADRLVVLQDRYLVALGFVMGALVPAALGLIWGDPIGALLVAGFLRLVVQWHATFSINSLAHMIGSQPFSIRNSARDSFWTAFLTLGEGYHNFHHAFQHDYRNGIRWYHYDPTKWALWSLDKVGLAKNLRRVARASIETRREAVAMERRERRAGEKTVLPTTLESSSSAPNVDEARVTGVSAPPTSHARVNPGRVAARVAPVPGRRR